MKRFTLALVAISFIMSFAGCGQSGPLYLPGNPSKLETMPPDPTNSDKEEKEQEEREGG